MGWWLLEIKYLSFKKFKINFHFRKNITGRKKTNIANKPQGSTRQNTKNALRFNQRSRDPLTKATLFCVQYFLLLTFKIFPFFYA